MQQVAKLAGVSATTVSFVLNDRPHTSISEATRRRVRQAAAEIGYRPNAIARSLVQGQTYTLGLVLPSLANPFFAELAELLQGTALARGYDLQVAVDNLSTEQEAQQMERLVDRRVDGILIWGGQRRDAYEAGRRLEAFGIAYVALGNAVEDDVTGFVSVDRAAGLELAVERLVRAGRRRIAYLGANPRGSKQMSSKYRGFLEALARRGLEPGVAIPLPADDVPAAGYRQVGYDAGMELANTSPAPDAVVCASDLIAFGALAALHDRGVRVPEDMAVVGFDGVLDGAFVRPALTTIAQPTAALAEHGLSAVLALRDHPTAPPPRIKLQPHLIIRQSCGTAPAR